MPIYSQCCPLVSEEKIFKELICIILGKKQPCPHGGLIYYGRKLFLAILLQGHQMIIYANLQPNLLISFGEDFQRINMHYNRKNSPAPMGAFFIDGESWFWQFW